MDTPILLIIYNRPDKVKRLILSLSKIKPSEIYVFSDGPKNKEDEEKVNESRDQIKSISWTKNIKKNFLNINKGCRDAPHESIDWFFENVEEGIILEDDCIPNQSFFDFTTELLNFYKNDQRISSITGFNYGNKLDSYSYDYYFSMYSGGWGWASWKNKWQEYRKSDLNSLIADQLLLSSLKKRRVSDSFFKNVKKSMTGQLDAWDYTWSFYNMSQGKLSVVPQKNFISNIGFGKDATHTKLLNDMARVKREVLGGTIRHPNVLFANSKIDERRSLSHNKYFQLYKLIKSRLKKFKLQT